jgi:AcrR family transcriptional regulator
VQETGDRRSALLEAVSDHVLDRGLGASSLRQLAEAAGTSDRMLLYYFRDKAELVEAALGTLAGRLAASLDEMRAPGPLSEDDLRGRLVPAALDSRFRPFMQLWLEVAAMAARGDAICGAAGRRIAEGFLDWIGAQLAAADDAARRAAAARILASVEGMVILEAVGVAGACVDAVAGGQSGRGPAVDDVGEKDQGARAP